MTAKMSRRQFFPMLIHEVIVNIGATKGKLAYQLDAMDTLPDEKLALICPMINPACQIRVIDGQVYSQFKDPPDSPMQAHFATTSDYLAVFNRFNGRQSLAEIANSVADECGWAYADAFAFTRAFFLALAHHLVVVPKNPLDSDLE